MNFVKLKWLSISTRDSTAAELRLALTITLTLTDTGFTVLTLLLGYRRRSPSPNASIQIESPVLIECPKKIGTHKAVYNARVKVNCVSHDLGQMPNIRSVLE